MQSTSFTPLYRATVGIDRLIDMVERGLNSDAIPSYPPYNIEKTGEDSYRVSLAVAGFKIEEFQIEATNDVLTITAESQEDDKQDKTQFLHRGIAKRGFKRQFTLAEHIKVVDATHENGLLHIELKREVPEAAKPQKVTIKTN